MIKLNTGSVGFGAFLAIIVCMLFGASYMPILVNLEVEKILQQPLPEKNLCNDSGCHLTKMFDPPIVGMRFYFGKYSIDPRYLVNEIDTVGDVISIYPDKIALPDSLEFPILIDVSHGHSIEAKYIQMWTVTGLKWMKLSERSSDWIARSDVIRRLK